jgi:hypothetical protein
MFPENRKAVSTLLATLEPQILGKQQVGFRCNCGAIHFGPATAVGINVPEDRAGDESNFIYWTVRMAEIGNELHSYNVGLTTFVSGFVLERLFQSFFGDRKQATELAQLDTRYRLAVHGYERALQQLPLAVAIKDTDKERSFFIDWGEAQSTANLFKQMWRYSYSNEAPEYQVFLGVMGILKPVVYARGPVPVLPFERVWLLDYQQAVSQLADKGKYSQVSTGHTFESRNGISFVSSSLFVFKKIGSPIPA